MNQLQADRCIKLAQFIEKLPNAKWDFSDIRNVFPNQEVELVDGEIKVSCTTVACALGWCPNVFPSEIGLELDNPNIDFDGPNQINIFLKKDKNKSAEYWGPEFFGLDSDLFCEIFYGTDSEEFYGEYHLSDVTKQMVADKLYEAVENAGYEIVSY